MVTIWYGFRGQANAKAARRFLKGSGAADNVGEVKPMYGFPRKRDIFELTFDVPKIEREKVEEALSRNYGGEHFGSSPDRGEW